jgi:hypothetical protein
MPDMGGGGDKDGKSDFPMMRMGPGRGPRGRSAVENLVTGLVVAAGSAAFWFFNQHSWWIGFIFLFGGIMPLVRGLRGVIANRIDAPRQKKLNDKERTAENERTILKIAASRGGRVTPSLVVLESGLSLEEAERALDAMSGKGHASLRIRDDGRVEYEFSEFLPG